MSIYIYIYRERERERERERKRERERERAGQQHKTFNPNKSMQKIFLSIFKYDRNRYIYKKSLWRNLKIINNQETIYRL